MSVILYYWHDSKIKNYSETLAFNHRMFWKTSVNYLWTQVRMKANKPLIIIDIKICTSGKLRFISRSIHWDYFELTQSRIVLSVNIQSKSISAFMNYIQDIYCQLSSLNAFLNFIFILFFITSFSSLLKMLYYCKQFFSKHCFQEDKTKLQLIKLEI